nr:hypothetical protein BCU36_17090 [Vibrio lentus]
MITGASSGIGAATARKLSDEGYALILLARRKSKLNMLASELSTPCHVIPVSVSDKENLSAEIDQIPQHFRGIDLLVNSAGVTLGEGAVHERDIDEWCSMVDANVKGTVFVTRLVLPLMVERNKGHIINIGSTAGTYPRPGNPIYCASKAFVTQFALALRADLKGKNIRLSSLEPGTVSNTELALGRVGNDHQRLKALYEGYSYLEPEDIAETIYWTASLPKHININRIDMMATCQAFSNLTNTSDLEMLA